MTPKKILLIEDDTTLRLAIETFLSRYSQYQVKSVADATSGKDAIEHDEFDLVLSDIKMPGGSGYDLLQIAQKNLPGVPFIIMTAYGTIEDAVSTMKSGAYDFIMKPFQLSTLQNVIQGALADRDNMSSNAVPVMQQAQNQAMPAATDDGRRKQEHIFVTKNPKMLELIESIKKVAASKATVLIQGESGTGKEVIANMIHNFSPRRNKTFVAINCAALPDNLLESELFGHEKGAFTGAIQRQIGKFELSDGGTILLDEISEMSLNMQTKLLRVLQECEVYRIGGNKPIPLNLRVIASTNRDLYKYMKDGGFREDLYYRINVIPIHVAPLRERGDDVLVLANHYLEHFSRVHERAALHMDELARYKIMNYPWYGNVRELRNAMERAVLVGSFDQICGDISRRAMDLRTVTPQARTEESQDTFADMTLDEVEKRVILETLRRCSGNRTRTAEKLGISLRTLRNKLKSFRLQDGSGQDLAVGEE